MNTVEGPTLEVRSEPVERSVLGRVLVIDNEEIDRFTLARLLGSEGYEVHTAESGDAGVEALRERRFDVVVTDLMMPGMNGIQTIKALREIDPDIEIMLLTGFATVETAVAALRAGAHDYLLKPVDADQLRAAMARLLAVRRATTAATHASAHLNRELSLKVKELEAAKAQTAQAEARNRAVIETAREAIVLFDLEGVIHDFNPVAEEIFGLPRQQAIGRNLAEFAIPAELLPIFKKHLAAAYHQGRDPLHGSMEVPALRQNGEHFPFEISTAAIETREGRLLSTFGRDVTERKRSMLALQASEEQFRQLTENIQAAFLVVDLNPPKVRYISSRYETIWGKPCSGMYARPNDWIEGVHPDDRPIAYDLFARTIQGQKASAEYRVVRPDGEIRRVHGQIFPLFDESGKAYRLVGIVEDVTERKLAELAIQESEAKLKAIFDEVKIGILIIDPVTHRIVDANPLALEMVGGSRERVLGSVCHKFVCPADVGRCPVTDCGQTVDESERLLLTSTGEKRNIIKTVRPVVIGGKPMLLESFVDITGRKRAEQALAQAEEHFRSLFASIPLPTYFFDAETLEYLEVNNAGLAATGYSRGELLKMRVTDLIPPEFLPRLQSRKETLDANSRNHHEGVYRTKDGQLVDSELDVLLMNFQGRPAVLAVVQDVSARKHAEAERAERHHLASMVAEVGVTLARAERRVQGLQQCTEILVRQLGAAFARIWTRHDEENFLELQASAGLYTHTQGTHARVPVSSCKIGSIADTGDPHLSNSVQEDSWVSDPEWARREGMVAFAGYPLKVEEQVLGVVAVFARQALSETTLQALASVADNIAQFIKRKRAEEALRESEDRYRDLVENNFVLLGTHDSEGQILSLNRSAARLLGATSTDEVAGRHLADYVPPSLLPQFQSYLQTILQAGHAEGRMVLRLPNGVDKIIEYRNTLRIRVGKAPIVRWTGQDVTERVRAEDALQLTQFAIDHSADATIWLDRQGKIAYANEAACVSLGWTQKELLARTIADINPDLSEGAWNREWERMKAAHSSTFEARHIDRSGHIFPVEVTANYGEFGGKAYVFAFTRDITQRKESERQNRLQISALEAAANGMFICDHQGRIIWANPASTHLTGYQPTEVLGRNPRFLKSGKQSKAFYRDLWSTILSGNVWHGELVNRRKDGTHYTEEMTVTPVRDEKGDITHFIAVKQDITERKRAEEELRFKTALLEAESESTLDGILVVNREGQILQANQRFAELMRLPRKLMDAGDDALLLRHVTDQVEDSQAFLARVSYLYSHETEETRDEMKFKDGRVFDRYSTPLTDAKGHHYGRVWYFRDITERRRAEQALWESQEQLAGVLNNSAAIIFLKDTAGRYLRVNQAFEKLAGLAPGEALGKTDFEVFPKEIAETFWANDQQVFREKTSLEFEETDFHKGSLHVYLSVKFPLYDAAGILYGIAGISTDITERKRAEEQRRLQTAALESAANGIAIADRHGKIVWVNPAFSRLTGYAESELLGQTMRLLKSGLQSSEFYQNLWETITSGKVWQGEIVNQRKDGTLYTDDTTITPVRNEAGTLSHFVAIKQDATERKQAEKALEERTAYLNTLFEISPMGIVVLDIEGRIQMSNSAFERLFRYSREELLGKRVDEFLVPPELASEAKSLSALCLSGPGAQASSRRRRSDNVQVDVEIYGVPLIIEGKLQGFLALYQDIRERKRAESELLKYAEDLEVARSVQEEHAQELARLVEELARERDLLGTLMDNLPDFIYYKDRQSRFLRTNAAHAKVLQLADRSQAVGKTDFDFFPRADAEDYFADERRVLDTGEPLTGKMEKVRHPDGQSRWYLTSKVPIRDAQGSVVGLVGITRDMTERMQAEEILRASEERYRELFENATDIVYTTGLDTRLTSLNRVGQQVLGYSAEEATQIDLTQLVAPRHRELMKRSRAQLLAGEQDLTIEIEVSSKDNRLMLLEVKPRLIYRGGKPVGVQGIGRDITGRDAAEMELRHTQKLESVGRLAAGIAHEINTPIQFVGDNTRFLQDSFGGLQALLVKYQQLRGALDAGRVPPELLAEVHEAEKASDAEYLQEEIPKALSQTLDGVTRVATIVRAMKEFAHPESKELAAAELNRALLSTLTVARNELKYVAEVETELGELPLVVCNIGDLNQVFLNLLVNAAHAIGEAVKGTEQLGKIRVCTVAEGRTVLVTISDTGCGIPEAVRSRVFDPFFTTKEVGRGTGQGLAIARSVVVDRHKGSITFESEVGKGTTFYVRLPIDPGELKENKSP